MIVSDTHVHTYTHVFFYLQLKIFVIEDISNKNIFFQLHHYDM